MPTVKEILIYLTTHKRDVNLPKLDWLNPDGEQYKEKLAIVKTFITDLIENHTFNSSIFTLEQKDVQPKDISYLIWATYASLCPLSLRSDESRFQSLRNALSAYSKSPLNEPNKSAVKKEGDSSIKLIDSENKKILKQKPPQENMTVVQQIISTLSKSDPKWLTSSKDEDIKELKIARDFIQQFIDNNVFDSKIFNLKNHSKHIGTIISATCLAALQNNSNIADKKGTQEAYDKLKEEALLAITDPLKNKSNMEVAAENFLEKLSGTKLKTSFVETLDIKNFTTQYPTTKDSSKKESRDPKSFTRLPRDDKSHLKFDLGKNPSGQSPEEKTGLTEKNKK